VTKCDKCHCHSLKSETGSWEEIRLGTTLTLETHRNELQKISGPAPKRMGWMMRAGRVPGRRAFILLQRSMCTVCSQLQNIIKEVCLRFGLFLWSSFCVATTDLKPILEFSRSLSISHTHMLEPTHMPSHQFFPSFPGKLRTQASETLRPCAFPGI